MHIASEAPQLPPSFEFTFKLPPKNERPLTSKKLPPYGNTAPPVSASKTVTDYHPGILFAKLKKKKLLRAPIIAWVGNSTLIDEGRKGLKSSRDISSRHEP